MIVILFFRYIMGYVRISFVGDFCERMLNLCAQNSATLWNIEKCKDRTLAANISVNNFKQMRKIRGKSGISVKIIKKIGLPFVIKTYSKRIGFALGITVFFFFLVYLSGFIWKIEVVGNEKISQALILDACSELNLKEGTRIKNIDTNKAKEQLLIKLKGLAWASLNIEGSRLTVNVSEIKNNAVETDIPSNLLARVDGVITRVDVKSGDCCVKVGDAVVKGDVLVSGEITFNEAGVTKKVQSKGEIIAETKRNFTVTVPKTQMKSLNTGETFKKNVLSFFSIKIPLYLGEIKGPYQFRTETKNLFLFGEKLPVSVIQKTFYRTKEKMVKISDEEAKMLAQETVERSLKNAEYLDYELVEEKNNSDDENFVLIQTYKCEENIAYEVKLEENILQ